MRHYRGCLWCIKIQIFPPSLRDVIESLISWEELEHLSQALEWNVIPSLLSTLHISHSDREGENSKCELRGNELLRRRAMDSNHHITPEITHLSVPAGPRALPNPHLCLSAALSPKASPSSSGYHHHLLQSLKNLHVLIGKINGILQCSASPPKN